MFKWYGLIGILLILFSEINFVLKIQPFALWYFPIIWFGYILAIDAVIYKLKKDSLISKRFGQFVGMCILSAIFWWIFEYINIPLANWNYIGTESFNNNLIKNLFSSISFATVVPAVFETVELFLTLRLFNALKLKKSRSISKKFIHAMWIIGIIFFIAPFFFPKFAFPLVWGSFFFILDPINYLHKQPSIIQHLKDRKLALPITLLVAGLVCGILWEFWNYWAVIKWQYNVPYVGFFKIFEMPLLGYLGYLPFAWELYAMYWFTRSLFLHKEHLLAE